MATNDIPKDPTLPESPAIMAFIAVTKELWDLPDADRVRVLLATAILLGCDLIKPPARY